MSMIRSPPRSRDRPGCCDHGTLEAYDLIDHRQLGVLFTMKRGESEFPSREHPLSGDLKVGDALDLFMLENGYRRQDYDAPRTPARVCGISFSVPNSPLHRWSIMRHDLHHIATGYGTDLPGEAEMSAWEIRRGIKPVGKYVGCIVLSAFAVGFMVAPRRTMRARSAAGLGPNLFSMPDVTYDDLLQMSLGDFRERLLIPRDGLASGIRGLNGMAPRRKDAS